MKSYEIWTRQNCTCFALERFLFVFMFVCFMLFAVTLRMSCPCGVINDILRYFRLRREDHVGSAHIPQQFIFQPGRLLQSRLNSREPQSAANAAVTDFLRASSRCGKKIRLSRISRLAAEKIWSVSRQHEKIAYQTSDILLTGRGCSVAWEIRMGSPAHDLHVYARCRACR